MTTAIGCGDVRRQLLDYQRGQLDPAAHGDVVAHLESCAACAGEDAAEQALTDVLERRLPQHAASVALKRRLAARWPDAPARAPRRWRRWTSVLPAAAAAVLLFAALPFYYYQGKAGDSAALVRESVNDHLRVLASQSPLDIRTGGIHEVKPWFEGRLDFAPVVRFAGDAEFPLQGGAVGYFLDRKAAVFVFKRRLHVVTLFVFPAEGIRWPARGLAPMGDVRAYAASARGFNVLLWREGELGYALVSDVDRSDLDRLGARLAGGA